MLEKQKGLWRRKARNTLEENTSSESAHNVMLDGIAVAARIYWVINEELKAHGLEKCLENELFVEICYLFSIFTWEEEGEQFIKVCNDKHPSFLEAIHKSAEKKSIETMLLGMNLNLKE